MLEEEYNKKHGIEPKTIVKEIRELISNNEEIEETLEAIGRKRGCLVRGGIVDYDKVYSVVMNDIKNGIIKGITFDRYE